MKSYQERLREYEYEKQRLNQLPLSSEEYDKAIRELIRKLKI